MLEVSELRCRRPEVLTIGLLVLACLVKLTKPMKYSLLLYLKFQKWPALVLWQLTLPTPVSRFEQVQ